MSIKVSVVVPAYRPGAGIDRVISSLDAQTMSAEEFELIIVDDGSPDDTWDRLQQIRDSHDNIRIERIENSGWPSRPRNIGIDMARGEYVLFMDHDDELYPDGLRAAYEYAAQHGADVLSPKESKTNDIGWGIGNYTGNIPNAKPQRGIGSLLPMMPHKFYRTAFLREHDIRFPEGRRMLWEDIYFNVAAFRYAEVISILSTTPVYRWVETDTNNSATYGAGDEEYWQKLTALVLYVEETLPGDEHAEARDAVLRHLYRGRVVNRLYTALTREPDASWLPMAGGYVGTLLTEHMPEAYDEHLSPIQRVRASLLRADRLDLLARLAASDQAPAPTSELTSLTSTDDGRWQAEVVTRWRGADGSPMPFRAAAGRLHLVLPDEVAAVVGDAADVTEQVEAARSSLVVRDDVSATTWALPSTCTVEMSPLDGDLVTPVLATTSYVSADPRRPDARWAVHSKNTLVGHSAYRPVRNGRGRSRVAMPPLLVANGRGVQPRTVRGRLVIDVHHEWSRMGAWSIERESIETTRADGDVVITADLITPVLHGKSAITTGAAYLTPPSGAAARVLLSARATSAVKARYLGEGWCRMYLSNEGPSRIRISVPLPRDGRYRVVPQPSGASLPIELELTVTGESISTQARPERGRR